MKEHPIIMTAESVLATLNGLKTQTRRVVTPQPPEGFAIVPRGDIEGWMQLRVRAVSHYPVTVTNVRCPYGVPGDRLWVRETLYLGSRWMYAADNSPVIVRKNHESAMIVWDHHKDTDTCSSIHMPRWASRILLEVADVRVQRVQKTSEADAIAEGAPLADNPDFDREDPMDDPRECHVAGYMKLWDSINAKRGYPWQSNPWVWAITYKLLEVKGRVAA